MTADYGIGAVAWAQANDDKSNRLGLFLYAPPVLFSLAPVPTPFPVCKLVKLATSAGPYAGCVWRTHARILVIEDNSDIAANIGDYLDDKGHVVDFAGDGVTGLHLAVVNDFDVIVLDLGLPGMDGLEVAASCVRKRTTQTPVLMLTARDTLDSKLTGFDSGADDYMMKPFALQELAARIEVLGPPRQGHARAACLQLADLTYNLDTLTISRAGKRSSSIRSD